MLDFPQFDISDSCYTEIDIMLPDYFLVTFINLNQWNIIKLMAFASVTIRTRAITKRFSSTWARFITISKYGSYIKFKHLSKLKKRQNRNQTSFTNIYINRNPE